MTLPMKNRLTRLLAAHGVHVLDDRIGGIRIPPESVAGLLHALREAPPAKGTPEHDEACRLFTGAAEE